ncbi:MAG: hypothetical protein ACYDAR_15335 [Thermomicrobiales bacterium]
MYDLSTQPMNDDADDQRSLERMDDAALVEQPGSADYRTELYARLRNIIDNATESIRALKEENASLSARNTEMTDRIGTLEQRIRVVTAELANDELALRKSAEMLEHELQGTASTAVSAGAAPADPEPHAATVATETTIPLDTMPEPEPEAESDAEPEAAEPLMEQEGISSMEDTGPIPHAEPDAPVMGDEREDERVVAPLPASKPDGTYTVVAYPFVRFSDLGQFQAALQKLAGVHDVQVRRFAQGTLEMRVGYSGATDLATTLRTLATEIEDVREEEPYRLSVRLRTSND